MEDIYNINKIWGKVTGQLKGEMSNVAFDTWIRPIKPIEVAGDFIRLCIPGGSQKGSLTGSMILTKYRSLIESSVENVTGRSLGLDICFESTGEAVSKRRSGTVDAKNDGSGTKGGTSADGMSADGMSATSGRHDSGLCGGERVLLNPRYTFENFVVGNNSHLAYAAALAVAESPARKYNPLLIYGGSGLGKTHLLNAIGNYYIMNNPDKTVLYTTSERFINELMSAIKDKTNREFREKYRNVDLLLMDDVQFLATRGVVAQEEFFHTFNTLYEAGKQIVLTSDRLPSEIPHLTNRVETRLKMGLLADIQPPDYDTRIAILKGKTDDECYSFGNEILSYIAENVTSNVRDLEGALKRILAYAGIERTNNISIELAKNALHEILTTAPRRNITAEVIIDEVEKYYHLPKGSLAAAKRSNEIAYPRHIAMYISRLMLDASYSAIGDAFHRDHSTVMNAVKKIRKAVDSDEALRETIEDLIENIKKN